MSVDTPIELVQILVYLFFYWNCVLFFESEPTILYDHNIHFSSKHI